MPRNGSDIYFIPPGTEGFPDTTIESAKYNTYIHDVETDLNRPRPISAGGTGADDADEALVNLGAEKSSQEITNYDSDIFYPGSFYSKTTASGEPVDGHAFVGIAVSSDTPATPPANQNVVLQARDQNETKVPGTLYVREKKAGVWGPWAVDGGGVASATPPVNPADGAFWWNNQDGNLYVYYNDGNSKQWVIASPQADIRQFVMKAGDTMTGHLGLPTGPSAADAVRKDYVDAVAATKLDKVNDDTNPAIILNKPASGQTNAIYGFTNGFSRWRMELGNGEPETGSPEDAGSNFALSCYRDDGSYFRTPIHATRSTGEVSFSNNIVAYNGTLTTASGLQFGGASNLGFYGDGSNIAIRTYGNNGIYFQNQGGTISYLTLQPSWAAFNGAVSSSQFVLDSNSRYYSDVNQTAIYLNGDTCYLNYQKVSGNLLYAVNNINYMVCLPTPNQFRIGGEGLKPGGGAWADSSDLRIKNVEGEYKTGLDAIAQLKPITFTFKGNDATEQGDAPEAGPHYRVAKDKKKFHGLVAQEVEKVLPEMVTKRPGFIDGKAVSDVRDLDATPLIYALINAVKELKARVETLEGK